MGAHGLKRTASPVSVSTAVSRKPLASTPPAARVGSAPAAPRRIADHPATIDRATSAIDVTSVRDRSIRDHRHPRGTLLASRVSRTGSRTPAGLASVHDGSLLRPDPP